MDRENTFCMIFPVFAGFGCYTALKSSLNTFFRGVWELKEILPFFRA